MTQQPGVCCCIHGTLFKMLIRNQALNWAVGKLDTDKSQIITQIITNNNLADKMQRSLILDDDF